ncbi:ABC transporter substrate-binding protein [Clostridium sp. BSD9I1]|uniref:ABC transporter substrate-binding protein n=1 Tax=Clostridium sp. BSD9I1 TaxID=2003589 RepID=UPI001644C44A|nr:ABC transporter substrate-binding protein [Clostridium sp. BSD9I1]
MFLLVVILGCFFVKRKTNKPIIIGFASQLTGRQAELGVQERNGVQLAIEKINSSGGIDGRKIQLMTRDDFGIPEKAKIVDSELIKEGAVAIIGHTTSEQTLAGLKVTNPAKVVMIGPTVSTAELSNLDDYFFRVYPSFEDGFQIFSRYIYEKMNITQLAIIYDIDNYAYSNRYCKNFGDRFETLGGDITGEAKFSSIAKPDFFPLLSKLREAKAEGLLIIASDIDTAFIAQRARLMGWNVPLFTSSWAATDKLIKIGGKAVEGLIIEQAYALGSQIPTFNNFKLCYEDRFGNVPSYGATLAYDAAMILGAALKRTEGKAKGLKQALMNTTDFQGVMGTFSFNQFGDVKRPLYLSTIRNGEFINIDMLTYSGRGGE